MDPEMRRMLQDIAATTAENNEMLKKLYRSMVVGRVFRVVYWIIILAVAVGAFYFIQPYIEAMANLLGMNFGDGGSFLEFFQNFR